MPSVDWTGTAGSGFSTTPTDPTRTTAKPACRLLVPPAQFFTDELTVGVIAMANNGGSMLDNLGLEKVTCHFEGASTDILAPSFRTFNDANGNAVTYFGWWVTLKKPAGTAGKAHVYFEAVPKDATMQNRMIGPYNFFPETFVHDYAVEVAPSEAEVAGSSYQTLNAAVDYLKGVSARNPHITIVEAGSYTLTDLFPSAWAIDGRYKITSSVPGAVIEKTGYTTDAAAILDPRRCNLHLQGSNITIDLRYILQIEQATSGNWNPHWFDGIVFTDSGGRDELWRGGPKHFNNFIVRSGCYFTECDMSETTTPLVSSALARGCTLNDVGIDVFSNSLCMVDCTVVDHNDEQFNSDFDAFTVQYTGGEATATLARSGGTEGSGGGGVYTAKWGANTATFDVGNGSEAYYTGASGDGYWFQDVVDWLNTLPGWSATMQLSPDRRACTGSLAGAKGQGFGDTDVKSAALQVVSMHDKHGDIYQHASGALENVILWGIKAVNYQAQPIFLCPIPASGLRRTRDFFAVNCAFAFDETPRDYGNDMVSQIGRTDVTHSHVVIAHNTFANQEFWMRTDNSGYDLDGYCLIANNTMEDLVWKGAVDADLVIANNHLHAGATNVTGSFNTSIGGSAADLFVDAFAGEFSPAAGLSEESVRKVPVIKFDRQGTARSGRDAAGSEAMLA